VASCFFDTSALAKLYHSEPGRARVTAIFHEPGRRFLVSRLTVLEMHSTFAIKVRTGSITAVEANALSARFRADLVSNDFQVFAITDLHYGHAERLIIQYALGHRLRSLDALQLAVALDLKDQGILQQIVAADRTVCEIAAAEGMLVIDPQMP
jgi:predicted nucleic acid-binding protein